MNNFYETGSYYGQYRTRKFTDIYADEASFLDAVKNSGIPLTITEDNLKTLYYLLYARYGNSHIASYDENQFNCRLCSIIFCYGLKWQKRLEAQDKLSKLTDEEIRAGGQSIYNHAENPGDATSNNSLLGYINNQNVNFSNKSKVSAYADYYDVFRDCTGEFLEKFKILFITVLAPDKPLLYAEE